MILYGVNRVTRELTVSLNSAYTQAVPLNHEDGMVGAIFVFDNQEDAEKFCPDGSFTLEIEDGELP